MPRLTLNLALLPKFPYGSCGNALRFFYACKFRKSKGKSSCKKKTAEAAFALQSVLYFFSSSEEATFSLGAFFFRYSK